MSYSRLYLIVLAVPVLLLLVACGGGPSSEQVTDDSRTPAESTPRKATATPARPSVRGELQTAPTDTPAPPAAPPAPSPPAEPATPAPDYTTGGNDGPSADPAFVGSWRAYSEYIYYDAGGGGGSDASASGTRLLELNDDGTWQFGSSYGYWWTEPIAASDWDRWAVPPYGPERKLVLEGWNGGVESGPVEESGGYVDFVWVIYHVDSPEPGLVYIKFGH